MEAIGKGLFRITWISFLFLLISFFAGCDGGGVDQPSSEVSSSSSLVPSFPEKPAQLRVSLTDKPSENFEEVNVLIQRIELWLSGHGKNARLVIGEDLGYIDLLTLRNGVLLPVSDIVLPEGISINKIRMILAENGHYGLRESGEVCELQTPSAQKTGIKINLRDNITFETGYSYSLIIDFDADKSVVEKGNGDCLLKPVLKLPSFTRVASDSVPLEGGESSDPTGEEPVTDGQDGSETVGGGSGSTGSDTDLGITDPSGFPDEITEEELSDYFL